MVQANKFWMMSKAGTDLYQHIVKGIPLASNYLTSPQFKMYEQAQRNFINAVLRRESGAAIAESEFANARIQYFPQPNDPPEVELKRKNRELAIELMLAGAGAGGQYAKDKAMKSEFQTYRKLVAALLQLKLSDKDAQWQRIMFN